MSKIKSKTVDPENYSKLSVPFESSDTASEALENFYKEVGELRKKHKIPDLLMIVKASVKYEDGEIGDIIHHSFYGNVLNQLPMAAYVYGQTQADHEEVISRLLKGKTKSA
jgi:hypothetical protein